VNKIKDALNIASHLNLIRIANLFRLKSSYFIAKWFKFNFHQGKPFSLSIEPTTACNLGCPECPSGLKQFTRPTGKLTTQLNEQILNQVHKHVFYINYYFQGEPFLNPNFLDLIKQAKEKKIYTATSTNGHFISKQTAKNIVESKLDRLIISIDGLTEETYTNYRVHGNLNKVLEGAKHIIEAKKELKSATPHVIFQFLVVKQNEHEIDQIIQLGKEMGADEVRLKSAQVYDYEHGNPLIPENSKYARYKKQKDGTYRLKWKLGNHCWRMWSSCVFTWDGRVVPCCFDKDASFQLGRLENNNFSQIWNSEKYNAFRQNILKNRNEISICKNCSEGAKVWI